MYNAIFRLVPGETAQWNNRKSPRHQENMRSQTTSYPFSLSAKTRFNCS